MLRYLVNEYENSFIVERTEVSLTFLLSADLQCHWEVSYHDEHSLLY